MAFVEDRLRIISGQVARLIASKDQLEAFNEECRKAKETYETAAKELQDVIDQMAKEKCEFMKRMGLG